MNPLPLKECNLVMETANRPNKIKFRWSIRNVHKLPGLIRSSKFSLAPGQPCDWDVSVRCESGDTFEFSLTYHAQPDAAPIRVESCSRILKNGISVVVSDCQSTHLFDVGDSRPLMSGVRFPENGSEDDKLVFQCSMTVHGYGLVCSRNLSIDREQEIEDLRSGYLDLKHSREFADLTIRSWDSEFWVHSCILKHLAPRFLSFDREEFPIRDLTFTKSEAFSDMLRSALLSIYLGEVDRDKIKKHLHLFYRLAARYELTSLRRACIREFADVLNVDNVTVVHNHADNENDDELKNLCIEFINDNLRELKQDIIYIHYQSSRPELP